MIRRSFVLGGAGLALLPVPGSAADSVSGRFVCNGKEARLAFASAWPHDPHNDQATIMIVLTEKNHAASKQPWIEAGFGNFGAALRFSLTRADARLIGSRVSHPGLKRSPISVSGTSIKAEGATIAANRVEGRFFTPKPDTFFDDTYEFDMKVAVDIRPRPA